MALLATAGDTGILDALAPNRSLRTNALLGVNLGKNKTTAEEDAVRDYVCGIMRFGAVADVLVVNVSSPNTPGLRGLQRKGVFEGLLKEVVKARDALPTRTPVLVKVAPDLDDDELKDVADAVLAAGVDGIIISNTTVKRPEGLRSDKDLVHQTGGLSGPPLKPLALRALRVLRRHTGDKVTLIGCGGIESGRDAVEFAKAGASFVQLYTAFGWDGVGVPRRIKEEVVEILKREGKRWKDIIGEEIVEGV